MRYAPIDLTKINIDDLIGFELEELCPDCGHKIFGCKHDEEKWCGHCAWATDIDTHNFSLSLGLPDYSDK